jgi:hypothetical protein
MLLRARPHRKIIPDMTREFRNNEFTSLAVIAVLPNNMTLTVTMVSTAQVNTGGRTNIWAQGIKVISIKMYSAEGSKRIKLLQWGSRVVIE